MTDTVKRCRSCGELAKWCGLNSEGDCENCSIICQVCNEPARIVGDLTAVQIELNSLDVCNECKDKL